MRVRRYLFEYKWPAHLKPSNLHLHHLKLHGLHLGLRVHVRVAHAMVLLLSEAIDPTVDGRGHGWLLLHSVHVVDVQVLGDHVGEFIFLFREYGLAVDRGRVARDVEGPCWGSGVRDRARRGAYAACAETRQERRARVGGGGDRHLKGCGVR